MTTANQQRSLPLGLFPGKRAPWLSAFHDNSTETRLHNRPAGNTDDYASLARTHGSSADDRNSIAVTGTLSNTSIRNRCHIAFRCSQVPLR